MWDLSRAAPSITAVFAMVFAASCVRTHFTPHKTEYSGLQPVTKEAVIARDGDAEELARAGGYLIGMLSASGGVYTSTGTIQVKALRAAARHGATHVIHTGTTFREVQITDDTATTNCTGSSRGHASTYGNTTYGQGTSNAKCKTTVRPGATGYSSHTRFALVRVNPASWGRLQSGLAPVPLPAEASPRYRRGSEESTERPIDESGDMLVHGARQPSPTLDRRGAHAGGDAAGAVAADNELRSDAPTGALGFVFGSSAQEVTKQCVALGGTATTDASGLVISCIDPVEANIGPKVRWVSVRLCESRACSVDLSLTPIGTDDGEWVRTGKRVSLMLVQRYGAAYRGVKVTPPECRPMYYQCLIDGRAQLDLRWVWPSGHAIRYTAQVVEEGGARVGRLFVSYFDPAAKKKASAAGL